MLNTNINLMFITFQMYGVDGTPKPHHICSKKYNILTIFVSLYKFSFGDNYFSVNGWMKHPSKGPKLTSFHWILHCVLNNNSYEILYHKQIQSI